MSEPWARVNYKPAKDLSWVARMAATVRPEAIAEAKKPQPWSHLRMAGGSAPFCEDANKASDPDWESALARLVTNHAVGFANGRTKTAQRIYPCRFSDPDNPHFHHTHFAAPGAVRSHTWPSPWHEAKVDPRFNPEGQLR